MAPRNSRESTLYAETSSRAFDERRQDVCSQRDMDERSRAFQSVDEVEQVKVVVNDPVQVKVKEAMAWNDGMCKEGF